MPTMTASGGTPAYMAPEVLLQQPDDGRSDLFSIGLVFYEMLGGDQPFQSDSLATTVAKIVHVEPHPLKNVSGPLAGVISRAIATSPDDSYPNASARTLFGDRALQVNPPCNLPETKTTTRPDARRMFGANRGLALTLERHSAELVKVTYLLLSTQSGKPVGSGSLTVPTTDAFTVAQLIADGAVKDLHLQLRPEEEAALKYHGTHKAAPYQYYLQAQGYLLDSNKAENLDNAALMAREALKLDPYFGMAKAVLGESYWLK